MAKLLSGRLRNLNVGISSYTEDNRVFTATGDVFVSGDLRIVGITTLSGLTYPTTDGSDSQILTTNGSGILSFRSLSEISGNVFDWGADADSGLIIDAVTLSSDFGLITESNTILYDLGGIVTEGPVYPSQLVLPSYTVSTLPLASPAGQMLFVTDETGGSIPAFSDGTNWRRVTDAQIVS